MKLALCLPITFSFALALSSCGPSGSPTPSALSNTGPFDRNGNYIEEWADNPAKWKRSGSPPSPHELKSDRLPEIAAVDQPPANAVPLTSVPVSSKPATSTAQVPVVSRTSATKPAPVLVKASTKPKPKPKPAPKVVRYVVKKGDTLSAIANRTGSSVSAIRTANRIAGSVIRPGQSLTIPKR